MTGLLAPEHWRKLSIEGTRRAGRGGHDKKPVIVAIGPSAGGVHALQIAGSRTHIPVIQVETRAPIEPNHVYVILPTAACK